MSVLVERDVRDGRDGRDDREAHDTRDAHGLVRVRPARTVGKKPRKGETRRPPTRARVVAGRPPVRAAAPCGPRRVPYRWPLLAALAAAVCLAVVGLGLLSGAIASAGEAPVPSRTEVVSVAPGDTLQDIAARFAPDSDTGAVVERIQQLNGLDGAALLAGAPLVVPMQG